MIKEEYAKRLRSAAWSDFSRVCRDRVYHQCQMCGMKNGGSVVHHMRYHKMGKHDEWKDVVVICSSCHNIYHNVHRLPPQGNKSRAGLLLELSIVLVRNHVDISYYLNHGDSLNEYWLKMPIVMKGVVESKTSNRPAWSEHELAARDAKRELRRQRKAEVRLVRKHWDPSVCNVTAADREIILRTDGIDLGSRAWRIRLGIHLESQPKGWVKRLKRHLSDPKWKPAIKQFAPSYLADHLDVAV